MIVTVTPNPSLDQTFEVGVLERGQVHRASSVHEHAGGKGINVSRALARHGVPTVAVLPVGGPIGSRLVTMLGDVQVETVAVPVAGETRTNVTLAEPDGTTTKINAAGPELSTAEVDRLLATVAELVPRRPRYVVAAGSLPGGAGADLYARLGRLTAEHGLPFVLDTSGPALREAVATGHASLLKPNDEELAELLGRDLRTVGDIVDGAREVVATPSTHLLVSLGAHGALLVTAEDVWWAGGPPIVPLSTVGAGDITLAGFLSAEGPAAARLRTAVAWGRAAVLAPGSAVPAPQDLDLAAIRIVHQPDQTLDIKEL